MTLALRLPLLALLALTAGCLYRMQVEQGNMLDPSQVEQLETGMTRSQVLYLLGTPMVPPAFNNDRWDYYHYFNNHRGYQESRRLTVWFEDEKVARIEDDKAPAKEPAAAAPALPASG